MVIQHNTTSGKAASACAMALGRIDGYYQHPSQYAVVAAYLKSLEPILTYQVLVQHAMNQWNETLSQPVLCADTNKTKGPVVEVILLSGGGEPSVAQRASP